MAIFRKRCDFDEAVKLLHSIAIPDRRFEGDPVSSYCDLTSPERMRRELNALRLFAVLVASKDTQRADWQLRGRELFDSLFELTLRSIMSENEESELLARPWLAERMQYYTLSPHTSKTIDELGTETGKSLAMLFADPPADELARLGRGVFFRAVDQTLDRHANFKIA
jgi:hypothetical protein